MTGSKNVCHTHAHVQAVVHGCPLTEPNLTRSTGLLSEWLILAIVFQDTMIVSIQIMSLQNVL